MATVTARVACPAGVYTQIAAATDVNTKVRVEEMKATTQVRLSSAATVPAASATDYIQLSDRKWFDVENASILWAMPIGSAATLEVIRGT